jgi:uncharacterized protein YciI
MKFLNPVILISLVLFLFINHTASAQSKTEDEWQMKSYYMVFLKSGPNRTQDSTTAAKIQKGHLDNITRLFDEKKLVLAGPFLDDGTFRGIFILDVPTAEAAAELMLTDPAIKAGRLDYELHPWYGPGKIRLLKKSEIME